MSMPLPGPDRPGFAPPAAPPPATRPPTTTVELAPARHTRRGRRYAGAGRDQAARPGHRPSDRPSPAPRETPALAGPPSARPGPSAITDSLSPASPARTAKLSRRYLRGWAIGYLGILTTVAGLSGFGWNQMVNRPSLLPEYAIDQDYRATMSEPNLAQVVVTDIYFTLFGLLGGLLIGLAAWAIFRRLGWLTTLIAAGGAGLAGLGAQGFGQWLGPRDFASRIAGASPGQAVLIDFTSHTAVPLAVWVGAAALFVLLASLASRNP